MSQVNWYRQLGLAIALFGLGTLAFWLEYKHKPEQESAEEQSKHLFQLKDVQVQTISIADGTKNIVLKCSESTAKYCRPGENSKWEMIEPSKLKADDSNTNALLSALNSLNSTEVIDLKTETPEKRAALLKDYGLDAASRQNTKLVKQVRVQSASGSTTLYLGNTHPIGESIFAVEGTTTTGKKGAEKAPGQTAEQVDETHVYLVPNYFKTNFDHDLTYWRDKKIMTLGAHEVASFKLDSTKTHLSAERKEAQWILRVSPGKSPQEELPGDTENIDGLLTSVVYLSAKNFASESKSDETAKKLLKGSVPVLNLVLQKEKGTAKEAPAPVSLQFFRAKDATKTYATVSNLDPLFELDNATVDRLDKTVKDLRLTKLITSMEKFSTKRLEFTGTALGEGGLVLTQVNGKWQNQADPKAKISQEKVDELLNKLSGNRIKEFLDAKTAKVSNSSQLKLTLGDEKTPNQKQLTFWKNDGKLYAKDSKSPRNETYLIDSTVADALPWSKSFFVLTESKPAK